MGSIPGRYTKILHAVRHMKIWNGRFFFRWEIIFHVKKKKNLKIEKKHYKMIYESQCLAFYLIELDRRRKPEVSQEMRNTHTYAWIYTSIHSHIHTYIFMHIYIVIENLKEVYWDIGEEIFQRTACLSKLWHTSCS